MRWSAWRIRTSYRCSRRASTKGFPTWFSRCSRGGTLRDRIAGGPLELDAIARVCTHVARGLAALHARGIVPRDVKPANILFDADDRAHVADFGLVKERDASVLTRPGQQVGTLDYMAPEQIRGEEPTPRHGRLRARLRRVGVHDGIRACPAIAPAWTPCSPIFPSRRLTPAPCGLIYPPAPAPVIRHALAKAPGDRPPTARAFAKLL